MNVEKRSDCEGPECPNCHADPIFTGPAVRQGSLIAGPRGMIPVPPGASDHGLADIGYRCRACKHEWGFEVITDACLESWRLLGWEGVASNG